MEALTMGVVLVSAAFFIGVGAYLHLTRKRAENIAPPPFTNPAGKRKPKKKR